MTISAALKVVAEAIRAIESAGPDDSNTTPESVVLFTRGDLGGMSLTGDAAKAYSSASDALWKAISQAETLTRGSVDALLQVAILQACDAAGSRPGISFDVRLAEAIKELKNRLSEPALSWEVHVPVLGLDPTGLPGRVGAITFRVATPGLLRSWKRRAFSILDGTADSPETKTRLKQTTAEELKNDFKGRTFASVRVEAVDEDAAMLRAKKKLRATLDVVNFFSDLLYPAGVRAFVYPLGERESVGVKSISFQEDQMVHLSGAREGPMGRFALRELRSKRAKRLGAAKISSWLGRAGLNSFEERVLSSFQWAGRATADDRREEAFLLYLISLESLMLGEKADRELGYRLRVRCAHLLGRTAAQRAQIAKRLTQLYAIRSKIVHAGRTEVTDEDLSSARAFAKGALVAVLRNQVKPTPSTSDAFENWFEARTLR